MTVPERSKILTPLAGLCLGFILLLSYFTYFHRFGEPAGFFWDENYHVAAAQKYLNGIFFMEPHPPLGKLLSALGEWSLDMSSNDQQFLNTNYASGDFTDGFSITGYRFVPTLLAWLTAPLLFLIFLLLTRHPLYAALLSFLYVFDNALIVHGRATMLEAPLLFFSALTILWFLLVLEWKSDRKRFALTAVHFGIALGLAVTTKVVGLILILLLPATFVALLPNWKKGLSFIGLSLFGFTIAFVAVWFIHFSLGGTVNPVLENSGWYQASEGTKTIIQEGGHRSLLSFPILLFDAQKFVAHYEKGVPQLDLCKPSENGSPFFLWPFGARSINYRWATSGENAYRYLYLQANPVVWFLSLLGVFLACVSLLAPLFFDMKKKSHNTFLLATFLMLYLCYMIAISQIDRVMYLYHYFLPLFFSFILFGIVFQDIERIGKFLLSEERKSLCLMFLGACIFLSYQFYRPLTYYEPITNAALSRRAIFRLWDLRCVNCERPSHIATPKECS